MEHTNHKKLCRSKTNQVIGGVCGGIAEYMNIDASVVRIIWTLVSVFSGIVPGILAYVVALLIIPLHPYKESN